MPAEPMTLSFVHWIALVGGLLLVLGFTSAHVKRLPISTSAIYLAIGFALGPQALGILTVESGIDGAWVERVTEVAVVVALFVSGLRMRLPLGHAAWAPALRLAGPVMVLCILGVASVAHLLLGLSAPHALLLGAVLAPTDPVLASAVAVSDARDEDRVKYGLSGEAGLNDGMAFPFVVLALEWLRRSDGDPDAAWLAGWAVERVLWGVPAALVLGLTLGRQVGRWAIALRSHQRDTEAPSDVLALALMALAYASAELLHAWGFLAVFAAGVGLRRAEAAVVAESPHPELGGGTRAPHPPAEHLVAARVDAEELAEPAVAAGVLVAETMSFSGTVERLLEALLVTVVGAAIGAHWDLRAVPLALTLFFVLRPLSAYVCLMGTRTWPVQRLLMGWFGIRGIGSLYYLAYALNHGIGGDVGRELVGLTLSVVAVSILLHGISATPLLDRYKKSLQRRPVGRATQP